MTDNLLQGSASLDAFLASARRIGAAASQRAIESGNLANRAKENRDNIRAEILGYDRESTGFNRPMLAGAAEVAAAWGSAFNSPDSRESAVAQGAIKEAVAAYLACFTKQGEKSAKGGNGAQIATIIRAASNAERVRKALASRVAYYEKMEDTAPDKESAEARVERIAKAKRYTVPAKCDGDKPAHNGRPRAEIDVGGVVVVVDSAKGTNRAAQFAAACDMFAVYGEAFLDSRVIDAFLDNGGKWVAPQNVAGLARKAIEALNALREVEPASPDLALFPSLLATLAGIEGRNNGAGALSPPQQARDATAGLPRAAHVVKADESETQQVEPPAQQGGSSLDDLAAALIGTGEPEAPTPAPEAPTPSRRRGRGNLT